jgi:hypothetical protein
MAATPHDSSGTTLTVAGSTFIVTSITINFTDPGGADELDISHLGQTTGETVLTMPPPLKGAAGDTGKEISFDYIGTDAARWAEPLGAYAIAGGVSLVWQCSAQCLAQA